MLEGGPQRRRGLQRDDPDALATHRPHDAGVPQAFQLVIGVAGLCVHGCRAGGGKASEGGQRAIDGRWRARHGAAEALAGGHGLRVGVDARPPAEGPVGLAERHGHAVRAEPVVAAHDRVHLVVMDVLDLRRIEAVSGEHLEQAPPGPLEARRGIHQGVVEIDQDEVGGRAHGHGPERSPDRGGACNPGAPPTRTATTLASSLAPDGGLGTGPA